MSNKIARKILLNSWGVFKTNKQFLQSNQIQRNRFSMTLKLSWNSNMKLWKNPKNTYCSPKKLPISYCLAPVILKYLLRDWSKHCSHCHTGFHDYQLSLKFPWNSNMGTPLLSTQALIFIMPCSFDPIKLFQNSSKIDPTDKNYSRIPRLPIVPKIPLELKWKLHCSPHQLPIS